MPYKIEFRGQAKRFRSQDLSELHPDAASVFDIIIIPWLERGPANGGHDLQNITSPLAEYKTKVWDTISPSPEGITQKDHEEVSATLESMKTNGIWRLVTLRQSMIQPAGSIWLFFGFDLHGNNPAHLRDDGSNRDAWCDFLWGRFMAS